MKAALKMAGVVLAAGVVLTGCENPEVRKQLEQKVVALTEAVNQKDQEIQVLKSQLAAIEQEAIASNPAEALSGEQIQTALKAAGFDPGAIDGKIGKKTKEALKAFQQSAGLSADGNLSVETVLELKKYL